MNAPASLLHLTGARLVALLMALAVALLWHPRPAGQASGAGPAAALLTAATIGADKGQAPRAALIAKRGGDDRTPGTPPGVAALAPGLAAPTRHAARAEATATRAACPPAAPCARQAPRAPPLA